MPALQKVICLSFLIEREYRPVVRSSVKATLAIFVCVMQKKNMVYVHGKLDYACGCMILPTT